MKRGFVTFLVPAVLGLVVWAAARAQQSDDPAKAAADVAAMMEKAKRFTETGERHKALERFLGKWTTEMQVFMAGKPTPAEKGTSEFSWLMPGRWMRSSWKGSMMGMPFEGFMLLGYDNFKQSYVSTTVTNLDTTMAYAEGDMDPSGSALLSYGTIDEYLTGEHDKMVKYVWRFPSNDRIVFEIHDLPIGEKNTKVIEVVYTRSP